MSPAGFGPSNFRTLRLAPCMGAGLLGVMLIALILLLGSGSTAHATVRASSAPLSVAWSEFQGDCVAGPSPGQGNAPAACVCWEQNLQAVAILPGYAVDALDAAQVGGGPAYTVGENLAGGMVGDAMQGCGLYAQQP